MRTVEAMHDCESCGRATRHLQEKPSRVRHAVVSLLTGGLWLPFWGAVEVFGGKGPQCTECGKKRGPFGLW